MSSAQYLAWEREQERRHEFFRGEVFAMAGGSLRHNALTAAITAELVMAMRGAKCRVLSTDQRIAARGDQHYVYADASVVCGPLKLMAGTTDVLENPSVVVEVLSKSTESYDRGLKWESYRELVSVADYLLVSQTVQRVEHYQKEASGEWHYRVVELGGRIKLSSGAVIDIDAMYSGVLELEAE